MDKKANRLRGSEHHFDACGLPTLRARNIHYCQAFEGHLKLLGGLRSAFHLPNGDVKIGASATVFLSSLDGQFYSHAYVNTRETYTPLCYGPQASCKHPNHTTTCQTRVRITWNRA